MAPPCGLQAHVCPSAQAAWTSRKLWTCASRMERALLVWEPQRSALEAVGGSHGEQTTHQDLLLEAESLVLGGPKRKCIQASFKPWGYSSAQAPSPKRTCSPQTRADPPSYHRSPPPLEQ